MSEMEEIGIVVESLSSLLPAIRSQFRTKYVKVYTSLDYYNLT